MAHAVLFVDPGDIGPQLLRLALGYRVEREQVAVFPLGRVHDADELVQVEPHQPVGMHLERVGGPFHDLVDVGIVEVRALVPALQKPGRFLEVADPIRRLALLQCVGDGHRSARLEPGRPEGVVDVNPAKGHRLDVVVALELASVLGAQTTGGKNQ